MLVLLESSLGLLIEADQVVKVADVALEKGDIVGDECQRIVDLMSDAGDHLAQATRVAPTGRAVFPPA